MRTLQSTNHEAKAETMRRKPGVWVLICTAADRDSAGHQVKRIRSGEYKAYRSGGFEAKHRLGIDGVIRVWGRWMGGVR